MNYTIYFAFMEKNTRALAFILLPLLGIILAVAFSSHVSAPHREVFLWSVTGVCALAFVFGVATIFREQKDGINISNKPDASVQNKTATSDDAMIASTHMFMMMNMNNTTPDTTSPSSASCDASVDCSSSVDSSASCCDSGSSM